MNKGYEFPVKTVLTGAVALLLPLATQAAAPVFDNWSVNAGNLTVGCDTANFTCETVSTGLGFAQVQLTATDGSGARYIQTVITDQNATGGSPSGASPVPYSDESFIKLGNDNGIMSKQQYSEGDLATTGFQSTSKLLTGWANLTPYADSANPVPNMDVVQKFRDQGTAASGDTFSTDFSVKVIQAIPATATTAAVPEARKLSVDQTAELGATTDGTGAVVSVDRQRYVMEQRTGAMTTAGGSITLDPTVTSATTGGSPTGGGTVTWAAGDDVMLRWIGQSISTDTSGATGRSTFGFEGVTVTPPGGTATEVTTFSDTSTGIVANTADTQGYGTPFDWDALFGTTPPTLSTAP